MLINVLTLKEILATYKFESVPNYFFDSTLQRVQLHIVLDSLIHTLHSMKSQVLLVGLTAIAKMGS